MLHRILYLQKTYQYIDILVTRFNHNKWLTNVSNEDMDYLLKHVDYFSYKCIYRKKNRIKMFRNIFKRKWTLWAE